MTFPKTSATEEAIVTPAIQENGGEDVALLEATAISDRETWDGIVESLLEPHRYEEQLWSSMPADRRHVAQRTLDGIRENGHGPVLVTATEVDGAYDPMGYEYAYRPDLDFDRRERWSGMQAFREAVVTAEERYGWDFLFIDHLAVAEDYRNRGIGQRVAAVRQLIAEKGWESGNESLLRYGIDWDPGEAGRDYGDPDIIVSLIRTREERDTPVSHIAEKLEFSSLGITSRQGRYSGVYRARPDIAGETVEQHFGSVAEDYNL